MTDSARPVEPASVAETLIELRQPRDDGSDEIAERVFRELGKVDRAVYGAVADTPTPTIDEPIRRLSDAASFSKLWMALAAAIALIGGRRGRHAAITGLISIGITSAIVNQGLKRLYPRVRPDREGEDVPMERRVEMPDSTSFPSGHSASGFAFATAVGSQLPIVGVALRFLAGAVAYSRVHTGVHYPGDAIVGSLVGAGIGGTVGAISRHWSS